MRVYSFQFILSYILHIATLDLVELFPVFHFKLTNVIICHNYCSNLCDISKIPFSQTVKSQEDNIILLFDIFL